MNERGDLVKKGGYKIVDFEDINITTENGATVVGVYESIESSHRKAILISGVTIDGVEKPDCFISCDISDGNYTFSAYGKTFTVSNADKITIA